MSLGTDLAAAVALISADAALLRAIVQGPASGDTSIVVLPGGAQVKTVARTAQEIAGGHLPLAGGTVTGSTIFTGGVQAYGAGGITTNTAIGLSALGANTTGAFNAAFGYQALALNTTGVSNTAFGFGALDANTIGSYNTGVGTGALGANTTGVSNTAIGYTALNSNTQGINNTALGFQALLGNTTGANNTGVGFNALYSNTVGSFNTAFGHSALLANTTGVNNTAVGYGALDSNTTGSYNTAVGLGALGGITVGTANTAIGYEAGGNLTTGVNNTVIGYQATASAAGISNEITLGNSSVATIRAQVTSITSLSDSRDKKNIRPARADLGLELIEAIDVDEFDWNMRDGAKVGVPAMGFIAQKLQRVEKKFGAGHLQLVYSANPKRLEATQGNLLPSAILAVKQLSARVRVLERQLKAA